MKWPNSCHSWTLSGRTNQGKNQDPKMTSLVLDLDHQTFYMNPIHYQTLVGVELGYLAGVGLATRHPRFFASQKAMWRGEMCPRFRKVRIPICVPLKFPISIHTLSQSYENSVFKKLCKDINFFSFNIKMAQQIRLWLMYFAFNSPLWRKHLTVISVPRIVIHVTNGTHYICLHLKITITVWTRSSFK